MELFVKLFFVGEDEQSDRPNSQTCIEYFHVCVELVTCPDTAFISFY